MLMSTFKTSVNNLFYKSFDIIFMKNGINYQWIINQYLKGIC